MKALFGRLRKSVLARMVASFVLLIIPLYVLGSYIYGWAVDTVGRETSNTRLSQVEFYLNNLESQILRTRTLLYDCINDEDLRQLSSIPESLDEYDRIKAIGRLQRRLVAIGDSNKYVRDVRAYIPSIDRVVKTTIGGYATPLDRAEFEAAALAAAGAGNRMLFWRGAYYLSVHYPLPKLLEDGKKKPLFILLVEFSMEAIRKDLTEQFAGMRREGAVLFDTMRASVMTGVGPEAESGRMLDLLGHSSEETDGYRTATLGAERCLVMFSRSESLGLLFASYIPEKEVFSQLNRYAVLSWLFTAVAVVLVALYGFVTYRQIHMPLVRLTKSFRKLEKGDMSIAIDHAHDDEFKYLYAGFNEMVAKLNVLIEQVYKQRILAQTAQLKQLQSQINPHFLYNSFFMLHRMVQAGDYDNLSCVSEQLGSYFKYITRNAADDVALSEEVEHARIYADIQAMRFRNRIRVDFGELPEGCRGLAVPRLILQPLIENAIEHGLRDVEENGRVSVRFDEEPGMLTVAVEDNGDGIGREELQALARSLCDAGENAESTGIINIHRRIRLMYGGESGLAVSAREGGGTRTVVRIHHTDRVGEEKDVQAADR